ncbi:hypothetical protein LINGRAHAP2_LOCUS3718 [Linum grandiflorum]
MLSEALFTNWKQSSQKCLNGGTAAVDTAKQQQNASLMEVAMKEAYFKGSLLDRVASLEHRLFQLCMEMESTSTSASSSQTSGGCTSASSTTTGTTVMGFRTQMPSSLPTFGLSNPRQPLLHHPARSHLQQVEEEKEEEDESKRNKDNKVGKCSKTKREEDKNCRSTGSNNKKQLSWAKIRPLKLLGC